MMCERLFKNSSTSRYDQDKHFKMSNCTNNSSRLRPRKLSLTNSCHLKKDNDINIVNNEKSVFGISASVTNNAAELVWRETQKLMDFSENLVKLMTHVCSQQLTGLFKSTKKGKLYKYVFFSNISTDQ